MDNSLARTKQVTKVKKSVVFKVPLYTKEDRKVITANNQEHFLQLQLLHLNLISITVASSGVSYPSSHDNSLQVIINRLLKHAARLMIPDKDYNTLGYQLKNLENISRIVHYYVC